MLEVPREQYLRCARIRAQVCEPFLDVEVSTERAAETLPEQGVPEAFVEAALEMDEADRFHPTMTGPASMRVPDAAGEDSVQAEAEEGDAQGDNGDAACHGEHDAAAEERGEASGHITAEILIGLDEAHVDDPGARFAVLQRKLELLQNETRKLDQKERWPNDGQEPAIEKQVGIEGQRQLCKQVALDIRELAKKMGTKYEIEIERVATNAGTARCPAVAEDGLVDHGDAEELAKRQVQGLQV